MAAVLSPVRDWQGAVHRDTAGDVCERFQLSDSGGQFFVDVVVCIGPQREPGRGGGLIGDSDDGPGNLAQVGLGRRVDRPGRLDEASQSADGRQDPGPVCG